MNTRTSEKNMTLFDDMVETWLADWSSLRMYVNQRRVGRPADDTFDTLLAEVLRTKLPDSTDVEGVARYLVSRPH